MFRVNPKTVKACVEVLEGKMNFFDNTRVRASLKGVVAPNQFTSTLTALERKLIKANRIKHWDSMEVSETELLVINALLPDKSQKVK